MDWLLAVWVYWPAIGLPAPCEWGPEAGSGRVFSTADLLLIELTYDVAAAESRCGRCGAPLGRGLTVAPLAAAGSVRAVSIVTRCRGWRRHRHVAVAAESSGDLVFAPFRAG